MTDHAPLTDEELAEVELMAESIARDDGTYSAHWFLTYTVPRLIADLRASRAMEASLRMIVSSLTGLVNGYTTDLADCRAEVERLRNEKKELQAEVDSLGKWIPNGW